MATDPLVQKAFRSVPKPFPGINVDLGSGGSANDYDLIVYEDQVMSLNAVQQEEFMMYLLRVVANFEALGLTCGMVGEPTRPVDR